MGHHLHSDGVKECVVYNAVYILNTMLLVPFLQAFGLSWRWNTTEKEDDIGWTCERHNKSLNKQQFALFYLYPKKLGSEMLLIFFYKSSMDFAVNKWHLYKTLTRLQLMLIMVTSYRPKITHIEPDRCLTILLHQWGASSQKILYIINSIVCIWKKNKNKTKAEQILHKFLFSSAADCNSTRQKQGLLQSPIVIFWRMYRSLYLWFSLGSTFFAKATLEHETTSELSSRALYLIVLQLPTSWTLRRTYYIVR